MPLIYTEEYLANLLKCVKKIINPPGSLKEDYGHLRQNFTLESMDGEFKFRGFIRQNKNFIENFSVGIEFIPKDDRAFCLLRCNGPHGPNKEQPHHNECHLHIAKADRINDGRRAEGHIEPTTDYSTWDDAIQYFIRRVNLWVADKSKYFQKRNDDQLGIWNQD